MSHSTDLLCRLLAAFLARGYPPDELSQEWDNNERPVMRLQWYTGHRREYAYTRARCEAAMKYFNVRWRERSAVLKEGC